MALTRYALADDTMAGHYTYGHTLPHVTITTTKGVDPVDTENYLDATITINGVDPYTGTAGVRGRGNSTWVLDKKPWKVKLTTAASLLGIPAERDYVLLANRLDPSGVRTAATFAAAAHAADIGWVPKMRYVELTMNGTYRGVYQLGEHVETGTNKVNVSLASGTTGLGVTGAYMCEIDARYIEQGDPGFTTTHGVPINIDDPTGNATQDAYIADFVQDFEDALFDNTNWLDPTLGYAKYVDLNSWADWYLIEELGGNQDSGGQLFVSSVKFYKTRDTVSAVGKLVAGPLWDFDRTFGVSIAVVDHLYVARLTWLRRMLTDPAFRAVVATKWAALAAALTSGDSLVAVVDRYTDQIARAMVRDQRRWSSTDDLLDDSDTIKNWIRTRIAFLNTALASGRAIPPIAADTFTRANGAMGSTSTGSKAWVTNGASGWAISSNAAAWTGTGDGDILIDSGLADDYEVSFTATSITGQYPISIIFRGTSSSSYAKIYRDQGANNWVLVSTAGGAADPKAVATDVVSGDKITCRVEGGVVTLYINDKPVCEWQGTPYFPGGTFQGIGGSGNHAATVDNFSVTPVLTPGVADTFTRANGSMGLTELGSRKWRAIDASGWAISSNSAVWSGTGDGGIMVDSGLSDDYEIKFTATSVTGQYPLAIIVRGTTTSAYGKIYRDQGSNSWVYTDTNSVSNAQGSPTDLASGDVIRVQVSGTTVTLFLNDVQYAQWTGFTYFPGGTYQGIGGSGNLAARVDDFSVRPIS